MVLVFFGCLIVVVLFVGSRWLGSRAENSQLKSQIAQLKRRLSKRDL